MNAIKLIFQPIRDMIALLKKHKIALNEEKIANLESRKLTVVLD
jgi:hypothetical protein